MLTKSEFIADQKAELDLFVGLITALLGLAILIALLGVANTLALSIFERTREIGLLRAVGMTRIQLRRMVRGEAAIVATFGALLGLGVGVFFGIAMVKAMAGQGIDTLVIPPARLGVVVTATAVLGVLAAVLPARKAASWMSSRPSATTDAHGAGPLTLRSLGDLRDIPALRRLVPRSAVPSSVVDACEGGVVTSGRCRRGTRLSGGSGRVRLQNQRICTDGGVAVVYDGVGADTFDASIASLAVRGTLALFGASSGPVPPFDPQRLNAAGSLFLTRPTLVHYTRTPDEFGWRAGELLDAIATGTINVTVSER